MYHGCNKKKVIIFKLPYESLRFTKYMLTTHYVPGMRISSHKAVSTQLQWILLINSPLSLAVLQNLTLKR